MKFSASVAIALALSIVCVVPGSVQGQNLPPVNLGSTSFMDGAPPAGPGLYVTQYFQYYRARRFNDDAGQRVPFPDPQLDVGSFLTQFIYMWDCELFCGASPAIDILVPTVTTGLDFGEPGPFPTDEGGGVGDLLIGPALQFKPIMDNCGNPLFVHRIETQFIIPTGEYSSRYFINPGSNFFSFEPYWAGTVFLGPKWASSFRAHYLWNAVNHDPVNVLGANRTQAGDAFHINFTLDREIIPKQLRAGMNGYWLEQTTDAEIDGRGIGRREQVAAFGPGFLYSCSQDTHLFFNLYFETAAENRPEGTSLVLRFVHHF